MNTTGGDMIHRVLLQATKPSSDNGFHFWLAVPWILTAVATGISVYQWIRNRRHWARVHIETKTGEGAGAHKRFFAVEIQSCGADLYDVTVTLEWKTEGTRHKQALRVAGDLPNPFKLLQSRQFYIVHDNPRGSLGLEMIPAKDMALVVRSGVKIIKRLSGRKLKQCVTEYSRVDETLPDKPPPPTRHPIFQVDNRPELG